MSDGVYLNARDNLIVADLIAEAVEKLVHSPET